MLQVGLLTFERQCMDERKIIHIDMDAFYASVEIRDNPSLAEKVVVMAQHPKETKGRGVVSTCNYKAREYGIHAAMSAQKAFELCPHAIFIQPRIHYYQMISKQVMAIFKRYTDVIEPLSLDEAFLDVTVNKIGSKSAMYIAKCIQRDIYNELQLTCSIGVSYNKFLAKMASDYYKPFGMTVVPPTKAMAFLDDIAIDKFYGVGKQFASALRDMGIFKGRDLQRVDAMAMVQRFGKSGFRLLERGQGIDYSPVNTKRNRKSVGRERTFFPELAQEKEALIAIRGLSQSVAQTLTRLHMTGDTIVLKIRYGDFETLSRQHKIVASRLDEHVIFQTAKHLLEEYGTLDKTIRLLGVSVTRLTSQNIQPIALELS